MKQKVIRIGSSIGVVIPKPIAQEMGFKAGQSVVLHPKDGGLLIEPSPAQPTNKSLELAIWLEDAVERYRPALEALKNK